MRKWLMFWIILGYSAWTYANTPVRIEHYQRLYLPVFTEDGELNVAIRFFKRNDTPSFLVVNLKNLATKVLPVEKVYLKNVKHRQLISHQQIQQSHYYQLFYQHMSSTSLPENQGITHALSGVTGNILTVDLCPSSRMFEKEFFKILTEQRTTPFPVALSISGMWILKHMTEFQYLLDLQAQKKLKITWVNHSFSHIYYSDLPDDKNFLLTEMVNLDTEVLLTEQILLQYDQVPSVFFRFPGLISSPRLLHKLKKYGLIPLGADAWLAKDQDIQPGSIVLIHGNGNEPLGVKRLIPQLKHHQWLELIGYV